MGNRLIWIDPDVCPYGHPRNICEGSWRDAQGHLKYVCKINEADRRRERCERTANRAGRSYITKESDQYLKMIEEAGQPTPKIRSIGPNRVEIELVCGHFTYQRTVNFLIDDEMFCRSCNRWLHIHSYRQKHRTYTSDHPRMTPLSSRHDSSNVPRMTPLSDRRNNRALGHGSTGRMFPVRGRKL